LSGVDKNGVESVESVELFSRKFGHPDLFFPGFYFYGHITSTDSSQNNGNQEHRKTIGHDPSTPVYTRLHPILKV
jgi:hypothetical protein